MLFDHELFLYNFSQRFYEKAKLSGGLPIFYSLTVYPQSQNLKNLEFNFPNDRFPPDGVALLGREWFHVVATPLKRLPHVGAVPDMVAESSGLPVLVILHKEQTQTQ